MLADARSRLLPMLIFRAWATRVYTSTFSSSVSCGSVKPNPKFLGQDKPQLELAVGWIIRERRFCTIYTGCSRLTEAAAYFLSYKRPYVVAVLPPARSTSRATNLREIASCGNMLRKVEPSLGFWAWFMHFCEHFSEANALSIIRAF